MIRHFRVIVEWDDEEKVFITHVPALNNLSTFGETKDEALMNTREAILGYIEAAQKEGISFKEDSGMIEWVDMEIAV